DAGVFTLSLHGRNNFPFRKRGSDLDVDLDDGTEDTGYLATLRCALPRALEQSRPDLAIYLAGADPFHGDRLGKLALTKAGLAGGGRRLVAEVRGARLPGAGPKGGGP